jgi:hypothetical protein
VFEEGPWALEENNLCEIHQLPAEFFAKPVFFYITSFWVERACGNEAAQVRGASLGRPVFPNIETFAS